MPGIQEYLPLAQLVANVLALPKTLDDQAQADNAFRSLAQGMPGLTPQQLDAIAPAGHSFAGADVPVLGTALRGLGTVGQVMQGVLGAPPSAPRPSLQTYLQLQAVGQGQAKQNAARSFADTLTNPQAKAAALAGELGTAARLEHPGSGSASENDLIGRAVRLQATDPSNPELAIIRAQLQEIQNRKLERARVAGGISYSNAAAGRRESEAIQDTNIQQKRQRGQELLRQQGLPASPGTVVPQGAIVPQSGATRRAPDGGFTLIGDTSLAGDAGVNPNPPLQRRGYTQSSEGDVTINMGLPDKVDTDLGLLASSAGIDLRNQTPEQSKFLLKAQEGLRAVRAAAARDAERIPDTDRQQIAGMRTVQYLLHRALTEFSPEERAQYVGILNNPARRALQFANPDPRFAEWMALISQIEAAKFDLGGKQLTGIEQDIVNRFIPTGRETGGVTDFDAKANEYLKSSQFRIQERLKLLGGAGQVRQQIEQEPVAGAQTDPRADFDALLNQYGK